MAWVLQQDKGLKLPKAMQADFSRAVQKKADEVLSRFDFRNLHALLPHIASLGAAMA